MQFRTSLHWAAVLGLTEIVGVLMEHGADCNIADAVGATALHYAVREAGGGKGGCRLVQRVLCIYIIFGGVQEFSMCGEYHQVFLNHYQDFEDEFSLEIT